uniref:Uncharacterized protein n=1 Tax=Ascaris lumbricoides TaxID=6252 RepID=A0A0M3HFV9_ASCLU
MFCTTLMIVSDLELFTLSAGFFENIGNTARNCRM